MMFNSECVSGVYIYLYENFFHEFFLNIIKNKLLSIFKKLNATSFCLYILLLSSRLVMEKQSIDKLFVRLKSTISIGSNKQKR